MNKNFTFLRKGSCIHYDREDRPVLEQYKLEIFGTPPPSGMSTSFGERNIQVREKLEKAGIQISIMNYKGVEYLVWSKENAKNVEENLDRRPEERALMKQIRNDGKDN